jgi:hypothetical protein
MEALSITSIPTLNRPILLLAFAGWNDAGGAATFAAKFLVQRLAAHTFASIDPETFYNFTEQRPHVRINYPAASYGVSNGKNTAWVRSKLRGIAPCKGLNNNEREITWHG